MEAAQQAEAMREEALHNGEDFIFETVLSTERNLKLLQKAKDRGYFIRCVYVLTRNPKINLARVKIRAKDGGYDVPEEKVFSRYDKALALIPELIKLCDIMHIYDNSTVPFRIFKKRKEEVFIWENSFWTQERIGQLIGAAVDETVISD